MMMMMMMKNELVVAREGRRKQVVGKYLNNNITKEGPWIDWFVLTEQKGNKRGINQ